MIGGSTSTMLEALHVVGDNSDNHRPLEVSNLHLITSWIYTTVFLSLRVQIFLNVQCLVLANAGFAPINSYG